MSEPASKRAATAVDLLALSDEIRAEIINGVLVEKEAASGEHNNAQNSIGTQVGWRFKRGGGDDDRPGGWWIQTEAQVQYESGEIYRHDLAGWRRDRAPKSPRGRIIDMLPDWVCEILSPSNASNDTVRKYRTLHRARVPHYWITDVEHGTVTVYELAELAYLAVVVGERGERLRLPPFDAVELDVGVLLGDDPD